MIACPEKAQPQAASVDSRAQAVSSCTDLDNSQRSPVAAKAGGEAVYVPVFDSMGALESPSPSEIEEQFA